MIELSSVRKSFGEKSVLKDLMLNIKKNEWISLVGPSGCGKTTALNIISGLIKPDYGTIVLDGTVVNEERDGKTTYVQPSKRGIGYVFQNYSLFPHMTVQDNVAYGLKANHSQNDQIRSRILSLLDLVRLRGFSKYYPHQLSGGQKQRVALARALATDPKILLLDEPLSALDAQLRESLRIEFKNLLRSIEVTAIYVTHDLAEACTMSDRIAVMGDGRIEQIGDRETILKPDSRFVAEFFGLNVYYGKIVSILEGHTKIDINGVEVLAKPNSIREGERVMVTIKPEDIVLSSESIIRVQKPGHCVCNSLTGTIVEISEMKSSAKITVDVGFLLKSEIMLNSLKELNLITGDRIYVQFKADSLSATKERRISSHDSS